MVLSKVLKNSLKHLLSLQKKRSIVDNAINLVVNTENINLNQFVESQFSENLPVDERKLYMDSLIAEFERQGVRRAEFVKSQDIANIYAKKRKITLEGIKLEVESAIYDDPDKFKFTPYLNEEGIEVADVIIKGLKINKMD